MNDPLEHADTHDIITIPVDPRAAPGEQVEGAIPNVPPRRCDRHPEEILPIDREATIRTALASFDGRRFRPHTISFQSTYDRCSQCPHNTGTHQLSISGCAVGPIQFGGRDILTRDDQGRPLPTRCGSADTVADRSPQRQLEDWLSSEAELQCAFGDEVLRRREAGLRLPFDNWKINLRFTPCLTCRLERLGIPPDEAVASFDSFVVEPSPLQEHLDLCRHFAAAPKGILLLLGNCGTGKTHLAVSILRERLRLGSDDLRYVKHRQFVAEHRKALRPVPFNESPPPSPMPSCQSAELLVYDDLAAGAGSRASEEILLELLDERISHYRPTVITGNVAGAELEVCLGTRLLDRLRRACSNVLEFGFQSKRAEFNADYLDRAGRA